MTGSTTSRQHDHPAAGRGATAPGDPASAVLVPDRAMAGTWSVLAGVAAALAIGSGLDAPGSVFVWALAILATGLTVVVGAQAAAPSRFAVRADERGVTVDRPWHHLVLTWDQVHLARVTRLAGEHFLECWVAEPGAATASRTVAVLLPMGADVQALHRALERHLGLADLDHQPEEHPWPSPSATPPPTSS